LLQKPFFLVEVFIARSVASARARRGHQIFSILLVGINISAVFLVGLIGFTDLVAIIVAAV
jgi:hypothetical protein